MLGLRYDVSSGKPEQAMRFPLPGTPILLTGRDYPIQPIDLLGEDVPRLDLNAALPPKMAAPAVFQASVSAHGLQRGQMDLHHCSETSP